MEHFKIMQIFLREKQVTSMQRNLQWLTVDALQKYTSSTSNNHISRRTKFVL